jgi:hypothetical protein
MPVNEGVHSERVAHVMNPWMSGLAAQPDQRGDLPEDPLGLSSPQRPPGDRHEEPIDTRFRAQPIPRRGVGAERGADRGVQRDQPHPVELRVADRDHALDEIDIAAGERDRLTDAHAGRRQQSEQRPIGSGPQRRLETLRGGHHLGELVWRVDEWRWPSPRDRAQPRWWDLVGRVDGVQVAGEAAHRAEPLVDGDRLDPRR